MHPLLKQLGPDKQAQAQGQPTAREILSHLLETKVLEEKQVQEAFDHLFLQSSVSFKGNKNSVEKGTTDQSEATSLSSKQKNGMAAPAREYRTRHVALRFYYDGANYSGLAENVGMETDNSIEKQLFAALQKLMLVESRDSCKYSRCGRTDRGVSSAGQVVAFHLKSNIPVDASWDQNGEQLVKDSELPKNCLDKLKVWMLPKKKSSTSARTCKTLAEYPYDKMLNSVLPDTIRILGWCPVSTDFSARFSATTRTYRYFFHVRHMNLETMQQALQLLVGRHDYRNLCKMDVEKVYNFERVIHSGELIQQSNNVYFFQIIGQAFLWHQIRCIVAVLFMVGKGLEEPRIVTELLDIKKYPGKPSYPLAPERPLVLHHCGFNDLIFGHSTQNLWSVTCELERQWEELILSAARIQNCLDSMKDFPLIRSDVVEFAQTKLQERFKKQSRHNPTNQLVEEYVSTMLQDNFAECGEMLITWQEAMQWLSGRHLIPSPESLRETAHTPLLQRHMGTTLQQKLDAVSKSKRRHLHYDEDAVKKQKTKDEDAAFYEHMTKQGGSAV
jgi:tRNA pseudouridine38/39 synthase